MEGDVIQMHEIFRFVKEETDAKGNVVGYFDGDWHPPAFLAGAFAVRNPIAERHILIQAVDCNESMCGE